MNKGVSLYITHLQMELAEMESETKANVRHATKLSNFLAPVCSATRWSEKVAQLCCVSDTGLTKHTVGLYTHRIFSANTVIGTRICSALGGRIWAAGQMLTH